MKSIALGCDPNASELKGIIKQQLGELGYDYEDYGSADIIYANVAIKVAEDVVAGKHYRGILICGTGIGVCIAANKVEGARAALCSDAYSTERSIKSNNANIMALGSLVTGPELAKYLVKIWLETEFDETSPSAPKVQRIIDYDRTKDRKK